MTISSNDIKAGPFTCNGVTVAFDFAFKTFGNSQVRVVRTTSAGVESDLVLTTDFTVALNADQNNDPGGTITTVATYADGKITIVSAADYKQETDLTSGGGFFPDTIENMIDKLSLEIQQVKEIADRAVVVDISSATLPSALLASITTSAANAATSATAAAASATAAATSETNAAASETAAAASETAAATSETNAATSATAAATSETNAATSATAAATSATAAQTAETNAETAETNAAASESAAATSATAAQTAETNAETAETNAAASAAAAATSASNAAASEAAAELAAASLSRVGEVFWWPHASVPSYAMEIDGSAISRTTYADLFAAIGTTWGVGDGVNTFNLPDVADDATLIQANGNVGTTSNGTIPAHAHTFGANDLVAATAAGAGMYVGSGGANDTGSFGTGTLNKPAGSRGRFCIIF